MPYNYTNIRTQGFFEDLQAQLDADLVKVLEEQDVNASLIVLVQILRELQKDN